MTHHHPAATVRAPAGHDKRSPRMDLETSVAVADYDGRKLPHQFRRAEAKDISSGGLAFYSHVPAAHEQVVVLLDSGDRHIAMLAQVVRQSQGYYRRQRQYLVAVRFVRRLRRQRDFAVMRSGQRQSGPLP